MTNITSINVRNNGEPVAICRISNGEIDLSEVGLIALRVTDKERSYQLNCYNVQPFSARAIKKNYELERVVERLVESNSRTGKIDTICNGRGLKVYFGDKYAGLISFGRKYDKRTIWDSYKREFVDVDYLGLGLKRYSFEVKEDFEKLREYLDKRKNPEMNRRIA